MILRFPGFYLDQQVTEYMLIIVLKRSKLIWVIAVSKVLFVSNELVPIFLRPCWEYFIILQL